MPQGGGEVRVDNVLIDGVATQIDYQVVIFDPGPLRTDEPLALVEGPRRLSSGVPTDFAIVGVTGVDRFDWRSAAIGGAPAPITGELASDPGTGGAAAPGAVLDVIDGTSPGYDLSFTDDSAGGNRRLHLAHPAPDPGPQWFELDHNLALGANSELVFDSMLAWATPDQRASVQISLDDGRSWHPIFTQTGVLDAEGQGRGETSYSQRRIDLGAYAGRVARLWFHYDFIQGQYYGHTSPGVGFHVDNIAVTDARLVAVGCPSHTDATGLFTLTDAGTGTVAL